MAAYSEMYLNEAMANLGEAVEYAVKGCGIIRALRGADDPRLLCGVEFSCKDEEGQYHILGYGHDPEAPALLAATEKGHGYRMSKMKARVAGLREMFGFTFPEEEIDSWRSTTPGSRTSAT